MMVLVVSLSQNLPIIVAAHFPSVVKLVVIKVDIIMARQAVNALNVIRPVHRGNLCGFEIDPDKPSCVQTDMQREKAVLLLVKSLHVLIVWGLGEISSKAVGPPVILARENAGFARVLCDHWESSMSANVVEAVDVSIVIPDEKEKVPGHFVLDKRAIVGEPQLVGDKDPSLGEDGTLLQLKDLIRLVPRCGKWLVCLSRLARGRCGKPCCVSREDMPC